MTLARMSDLTVNGNKPSRLEFWTRSARVGTTPTWLGSQVGPGLLADRKAQLSLG